MKEFRVGFGSRVINGEFGMPIDGYFVPRFVRGVLDDIEAEALYLSLGEERAVIISCEVAGVDSVTVKEIAATVERATGVPAERVFVSATHSHTSPMICPITKAFECDEALIERYRKFVIAKVGEAAADALRDSAPAKMAYGTANAPDRIAYIRRYRMRDGSTMTCPPVDSPDIIEPLGTLDQRVNVVRFDREGKESVVILNYGLHADTIGGEYTSPDFCGWVRSTLSKALDGVKTVCIIGAQGDVGSTNVHPTESDMNDTEISFDNEMKSPGMARFVGRALAGAVLSVYDKLTYTHPHSLQVLRKTVSAPSNMPSAEDMPRAREYKRLHESGRDDLIPYEAMELTTVVAEALRMCKLEVGPEAFDIELIGLSLGDVCLVGIPGEPFSEIGRQIKTADGFPLVLPAALTNGYMGYFPDRAAFLEGGYEARSSNYKAGVAELIIEKAHELVRELSAMC